MKAFISYSHKDSAMLDRLHTHIAQLKRDGKLSSWTDEAITAGGNLDQTISSNLESAELFIALLSPDYIASGYCYDKEFQRAITLQKEGKLIIVPIIAEPCDWLSTPFSNFKALPKDGKPISNWSNPNTAFLDVINNLRILLDSSASVETPINSNSFEIGISQRNYRVKKDFDSIQKIEHIEQSFSEIKEKLISFTKELLQVDDNIKFKLVKDESHLFEAILVNRNKIGAEATLHVLIPPDSYQFNRNHFSSINGNTNISYKVEKDPNSGGKGFSLIADDYHLFWVETNMYSTREQKEKGPNDMADIIWNIWLESVGIM